MLQAPQTKQNPERCGGLIGETWLIDFLREIPNLVPECDRQNQPKKNWSQAELTEIRVETLGDICLRSGIPKPALQDAWGQLSQSEKDSLRPYFAMMRGEVA